MKNYNYFLDNDPLTGNNQQQTQPIIPPVQQNVMDGPPDIQEPAQEQQIPPPQAQAQAQPTEEGFKYRTADDVRNSYNPIYDLFKDSKPSIDEKKQKRLQQVMKVNSIGNALRTVLQGYYGTKGASITPQNNEYLPKTYQEYMNNIKDYDTKKAIYDDQLRSIKLSEQASITQNQQRNEDKAFTTEQQQAAWQQAEKMSQKQFDERIKMFDKEDQAYYNRLAKQQGYTVANMEMTQKYQSGEAQKQRNFTASENQKGRDATRQLYADGLKGPSKTSKIEGLDLSKPFTYRDTEGNQITLQPEQLDLIDSVISQAASDMSNIMDEQLAAYASGKEMNADMARQLMTRYAAKYMPSAIQLQTTAPDGNQPDYSTGGAY